MLQIKMSNVTNTEYLIALWIHEMNRAFYDRLVDILDRDYYFNILKEKIVENLKFDFSRTYL